MFYKAGSCQEERPTGTDYKGATEIFTITPTKIYDSNTTQEPTI
jgi:hypothetical protein